MYTSAGNKSITKKATRFYNIADSEAKFIDKTKAGITFIKAYRKMSKSKSFSESGDTAVRESVWIFFERIANVLGLDADSIWDNA